MKRTEDWLNQAIRELEEAEYNLRGGYYELVCFLSQQSAEKAIKALLQERRIEKRTHSLLKLLEGEKIDEKMEFCVTFLEKQYSRYPDAYDEGTAYERYSRTEGEQCLNCARLILDWVKRKIAEVKPTQETPKPKESLQAKLVILFGSRARGNYTESSDYDVLVVDDKIPTDPRKVDDELYLKAKRMFDGEVDAVFMNTSVFLKKLNEGVPFILEVIEDGKVLERDEEFWREIKKIYEEVRKKYIREGNNWILKERS